MAVEEFDVVFVGGGPGGYVGAIRAAQLGLKTACIEGRGTLGGTCLNVGCIPSKALLESSHHFEFAKSHAKDHGIDLKSVDLNLDKMLDRKNKVVSQLTKGIEFLFKKNKVTYLRGWGSFVDSSTLAVKSDGGKSQTIKSKNIVISTGSEPIEIPSAKFDGIHIVSSTEALSFEKVPKSLLVIGGGVIGLELGSVWARLGTEVTVIEAFGQLFGQMDKGLADQAKKIFAKQGLKFHLNTMLQETKVKKSGVAAICKQGDKTVEFSAEKMLVAVGRRPFTHGLGASEVGIALDERGRVVIDEHFRTSQANVFAIGDVVKGAMLAHKAEDEGVAVAEIIAGKPGHVNYFAIPNVIYTNPEIAIIGYSEEDCKSKGIAYKKGQFPFSANGRAKAMGSTEGFIKILADAKTDRMIGFHAIGPNASELVAEAAVAFEFGASSEDIARSTHAHPTLAEAIKQAALGVDGRTTQM